MGPRITTPSASNTAFSDGGNILFNIPNPTALADRRVENSEIFLLGVKAYAKFRRARSLRLLDPWPFSGAPLCDSSSPEDSGGRPPHWHYRWGGGALHPRSLFSPMFNFSANHLFLLWRKEYRSCAGLQLLDRAPPAPIGCKTSPKPTASCLAMTTVCSARSAVPTNSTG
jgi:hypothetical protein